MSQFNEALRNRREALNLSPEDLARRLTRLSYPTTGADVQLWERGRNVPPLDDAGFREALAMALQVNVKKLEGAIRLPDRKRELSEEGEEAATLIDSMPEETRKLALEILHTIARTARPHKSFQPRDIWAED